MKQLLLTTLFVSLVTLNFAQQRSVGLSVSAAKGFLKNIENTTPNMRSTVPDIELTYVRYETEKISWKTGLGLALHTFFSAYNDESASTQHLDQVMHLTIPYHLNVHLNKWFYIGLGLNTNLKMKSITFPVLNNRQIGPGEENANVGRSVLLEGLANVGFEYNLGLAKLRLGAFYELPFNNREYFNLGTEISILYNLKG